MGLYAVAAAKGSPGVSTTAMALALGWGSEVVVADVDPAGGDLALRYRAEDGKPLDPERGLVSLAASVRRGADASGVEAHLQTVEGDVPVLVGVSRPEQVTGLGAAWPSVSQSLARMADRDVIADCGRVLPGSATLPVLSASSAVLLLTRPTLEELFHLRERLRALTTSLHLGDIDAVPVGVAVLTHERDRASAGDVQKLIDSARLGATVLGTIVEEPKTAAALRHRLDGRMTRSMLLRSAGAVAGRLRELAAERRTLTV